MPKNAPSQLPKLSTANFRERASRELVEIRDEVLELIADHDIYWKVQQVIQSNPRYSLVIVQLNRNNIDRFLLKDGTSVDFLKGMLGFPLPYRVVALKSSRPGFVQRRVSS